jgi:putative transcriptional regulator
MIQIQVDQLLASRGRTFYWLAKETGISHTTPWRLEKGKAPGINFKTRENICAALECQPGEVLAITTEKNQRGQKSVQGRRNS